MPQTDQDRDYHRLLQSRAEAAIMREGAQYLTPPTPEQEAITDLPLGGITEPVTAALEAIGQVAKGVAPDVRGALDVAGKAVGLDLPKGGAAKATEFTTGIPLSPEQMSSAEAGAFTTIGLLPLAGITARLGKGVAEAIKVGEATHFVHPVINEAGKKIAEARVVPIEGGRSVLIEWLGGALDKPEPGKTVKLGQKGLHAIAEGLAKEYPEAQTLTYEHITGARAGKAPARVTTINLNEFRTAPKPIKPLDAKERQQLVSESYKSLAEVGGSTYNLAQGGRPTTGYAVSIRSSIDHRPGHATIGDIDAYTERVSQTYDLHDEMFSVGTWFDKPNYNTELSISLVFDNLDEAQRYARQTGERFVYSLGSSQEIASGLEKAAGEAGKVDVRAASALAGALIGGAYGYHTAKPDESKVLETLKAAGLGAVAPLALSLAPALLRKAISKERPVNPMALTAAERTQPLSEMAEQLKRDLATYQRGHLTFENIREKAAALLGAGWEARGVPGVAYNAEQLAVITRNTAEQVQRLQASAIAFRQNPTEAGALENFLRQEYLVGKDIPLAVGGYAEAGRSLSYLNDIQNDMSRYVKQTVGVLGKTRLSLSPSRRAEIYAAMQTPEEIAHAARVATSPTFGDMAVSSWTMGLLSQFPTHAVNVISGLFNVFTSIPERALAAGFGRNSSGVVVGEASAMMRGLSESVGLSQPIMDGSITAWQSAYRAFTTGVRGMEGNKLETAHPVITGENIDLMLQRWGLEPANSAWLRGFDYLAAATNWPGKLLVSADEAVKTMGRNMEIHAQARRFVTREADADQLVGVARAQRIDERYKQIMSNPESWGEFIHEGDEFASYITFTKELGESGQALQRFAHAHPLNRMIFTFLRTSINIPKYAGERSPFALASKAVRAEIEAGGERRDLALAKMGVGSSLLTVFTGLSAAGVITGYGPENPQEKAIWKTDKRTPYSLNTDGLKRLLSGQDPAPTEGDRWVAYNRADYVGMLVGGAADLTDIAMHTDDPEVMDHLGARLTLIASHILTSKTYVQGAAKWVMAATHPMQYGERWEEDLTRSLITAVPVLGPAAKMIQREVDPVVRETTGVFDAVRAGLPGLSKNLPPIRNYWGEPQLREPWMFGPIETRGIVPFFRSTHKYDLVVERLVEMGARLSVPGDTIGLVKLSPQQHDYLKVQFGSMRDEEGKTQHQWMREYLDQYWDGATPNQRRDRNGTLHLGLRRINEMFTQMARQALYTAYPDLAQSVGEEAVSHKFELQTRPSISNQIQVQ